MIITVLISGLRLPLPRGPDGRLLQRQRDHVRRQRPPAVQRRQPHDLRRRELRRVRGREVAGAAHERQPRPQDEEPLREHHVRQGGRRLQHPRDGRRGAKVGI